MLKKSLLILSLLCFVWQSALCEAQEVYPFVAKIKSKTANLRAGQNANFELVGQVKEGDELIVVGASYDWRKVNLPIDAKAYVSVSFVKDLGDGLGEVTGNRLNIRASALGNASIVGQLKKGELIRILEKREDWYRIEPPQESVGWILNEFLEKTPKALPPPRVVQLRAVTKPAVKSEIVNPAIKDFQPGLIIAVGSVEDLANNMISADIRHYVQNDGKVYYLKGYRHVIDGFLHQKVRIEGLLKPDIDSDKPVLLVTKITLVM